MALTFFWPCEQTTLSAPDAFSAGDNTATANNSPQFNQAAAAMVGAGGLIFDGASERYDFTNTANDIITPSAGAIAVRFRFPTAFPSTGAAYPFFSRGTNSSDYVRLTTHTGTGANNRNLSLSIRHNTGGEAVMTLTGNLLAPGTEYEAVATWDSASPTRTLHVYDSGGTLVDSVTSSASFAGNVPADLTSVRYGDSTGTTGTMHIDQCFIGSAAADGAIFHTNRSITAYSDYNDGSTPAPSITDVDEDNTITLEQANVEIDGTDFDDDVVEIRQDGFDYTPSVDSNTATAIVFDMAAVGATGPITAPHAGSATVAVINVDLQEDTQAITISNRSGANTLLIGTPNADADLRLDSTADAVAGDYVMWFNVVGGVIGDVTVNDDLTFDVAEGVTSFDFQIWDSGDGTWGDAATQTIEVEEPEPEPEVVNTGAGSSRKRRYYVEVDGQSFPVNSAQEAQQILQRARALAEREAEVEASRVEKRVKRVVKKTGAVPTLKVETPQIKVSPELKLETAQIRADIDRLYKQAAEMAELRLHLAKKMAEEDEEDDELILML